MPGFFIMMKKILILLSLLFLSLLLVMLFAYNQIGRMELFGDKGKVGLKWEIRLPETGQYELVEVKTSTGKETLRGLKNAKIINVATEKNGQVLYDLVYEQDELGRRKVDNSSETDKFIIWFGGGDLYGMGVERSATIPQIFSKKMPEYAGYNYGFAGIGAQYPLRILETTNLKRELKESQGLMVYVISEAHYPKTLGKFMHIYRPEMPDYQLEEGKLVYKGIYRETEPLVSGFKALFGNSWLKRILGDVNEFTSYSQKEHQTVCEIVKKTNQEFLKQYPNSHFILFLHTNLRNIERIKLSECCQKNRIHFVDTFMEYDEEKMESDPVDGHPTEYINLLLVEKFIEELKKQVLIPVSQDEAI